MSKRMITRIIGLLILGAITMSMLMAFIIPEVGDFWVPLPIAITLIVTIPCLFYYCIGLAITGEFGCIAIFITWLKS